MASEIIFEFPKLPVSVNKLYFSKGGRRILSTEGRGYRNDFLTSRGGATTATLMGFQADPLAPYELTVWYFLAYERIWNITFGKLHQTKSPFADIDVSNMIKLVEDCIAKLVGVRDRNNFTVILHKREAGPEGERLLARLRPLDLEEDPYEEDLPKGKSP